MKHLLLILFLGFILSISLKAQTNNIYVPMDLSTPVVVVGTSLISSFGGGWKFSIDNGEGVSKISEVTYSKGSEALAVYAAALAQVSNKICKQGYKLMGTNTIGESWCIYIFQKE